MKIMMVCLGNICRSPIAEGLMQKMALDAGLNWTVDSAGTNGYHTGEAPHRFSQKVCKAHGIDISAQKASRFKTKNFDSYDYIFVMASDVHEAVSRMARTETDHRKIHYFLDALYPGANESVPDPWYGDEDGYIPVFELIEKGCTAIINRFTSLNR